ncbi:MAG: hypothetical protein JSW59_20510 [Phycisphaerales bacterium]|nr:MAG: hypothetical protein JSW59_20510 [Phycisphaerales bacterium]
MLQEAFNETILHTATNGSLDNGYQVQCKDTITEQRGHVGIQAEHGHLEFRDIRVRRLN